MSDPEDFWRAFVIFCAIGVIVCTGILILLNAGLFMLGLLASCL